MGGNKTNRDTSIWVLFGNITQVIFRMFASRDRIVVSTLRCGRNNPGSNPGHGRKIFNEKLISEHAKWQSGATSCLRTILFYTIPMSFGSLCWKCSHSNLLCFISNILIYRAVK